MKFYHAENSNRLIRSKGKLFAFKSYSHLGGTWYGTFKTDNAAEQEALSLLTANPLSAVTEIDEAEYERCEQKKTGNEKRSGTLNMPQPPEPTTSRLQDALPVGTPVTSELPTPDSGTAKVLTTDEILTTGTVATGEATEAPAGEPTAKTTGLDLM
jgi:hypothetical protein